MAMTRKLQIELKQWNEFEETSLWLENGYKNRSIEKRIGISFRQRYPASKKFTNMIDSK
jgi:hypothetical protein